MDILLLAGNCPRNPLIFPRRVTDGQLFNVFNSQGHTPYAESMPGSKAPVPYATLTEPVTVRTDSSTRATEGVSGSGWRAAVPLQRTGH